MLQKIPDPVNINFIIRTVWYVDEVSCLLLCK